MLPAAFRTQKNKSRASLVFTVTMLTSIAVGFRLLRTKSGISCCLFSSATPSPKRAVVIGGTGYVGSNIVQTLVKRGYYVRATTRNAKKGAWLKSLEIDTNQGGTVDVYGLDLSESKPSESKMDELVRGMEGCTLYFCAGFEHKDPSTIDFMVNNALGAIQAARRNKVESVILTSSGGSTNPPGHSNETPKNELIHWSDPDFQKQNNKFSPAAKTLMEIRSLEEVGRNQQNEIVDQEKSKDAPRLCIMNPNLILGPQLQPGKVSGNSLPWVVAILKGLRMNEAIPNDSMSIIDVRDLADLHVACGEQKTASGRYFGVCKSFPWEEILKSFEMAYPPYAKPPRFSGPASIATQFDFTRRDSLGIGLRSLQSTVDDLVAFLKERGEI